MRITLAALLCAAVALPQQRLEIVSALWGTDNTWVDVTERLRERARGDALDITVDIPTLGRDPIPGIGKTLRVRYRYNGRELEASAADFESMRLPEIQRELRIVSARFFYNEKSMDVRERLEPLIQDDRLTVRADLKTLGPDPAVGKTKTLEVRYEFRGNTYEARVKEDQTLSIPSREALAAAPALIAPAPSLSVTPGPPVISGSDHPLNLRVFYARYGVEGKQADVRDRLQPHLRNDQLSIRVDNAVMGGDPARGANKFLYVIYEARGRTYHKSVQEGQILTLP